MPLTLKSNDIDGDMYTLSQENVPPLS